MKKKIMVVDDEPDTVEAVEAVLTMNDFTVYPFTVAMEALAQLQKGLKPDLILLDMRMPQMSGMEVCDKIKKDSKLKDLKVAFFTASSELDKTLAKKHGALGFVYKPFDNDGLVKQIKQNLKS